MERVLTGDERVRKAEEIYYRRKMGLPNNTKFFETEKKSYLGSKIVLDILIILNISIIIVAVQNRNFIFTPEFLGLISEYNVNLTESLRGIIEEEEKQQNVTKDILETTESNNTVEEDLSKQQNVTSIEEAIVPNEEEVSLLDQMDLDVNEITQNYNLQKPIEGTVTSLFGARESVYQNVSGYHTGIDIGAKKGTSIIAAHSGNVVLVSSKGDYGKHLKIQDGNLETLYAHCSKILVSEGEYVNSGQEIAKVRKYGEFYRTTFTF